MNSYQELWWQQARSDHKLFLLLLNQGAAQCHALHQLQMTTEKIAKAYLWRSKLPPRSHAGFRRFLNYLAQVSGERKQGHISALFAFKKYSSFRHFIRKVQPIAYQLEQLAPTLANDGPNPEYPWPHMRPQYAPATFDFPIWGSLNSGPGRELMRIIHIAVNRFPDYADI